MEYLIKHKGEWIKGYIDECDYDLIRWNTWGFSNGYARCGTLQKQNKKSYLHQIITERMGIDEQMIDHINQNRLDNRRCNLRGATRSQNEMNKGKHKGNISGFKGVIEKKDGRIKKWQAQLKLDGKKVYSECFYTAEKAAQAYDLAALKYHGEYAKLNFPRSNYNVNN